MNLLLILSQIFLFYVRSYIWQLIRGLKEESILHFRINTLYPFDMFERRHRFVFTQAYTLLIYDTDMINVNLNEYIVQPRPYILISQIIQIPIQLQDSINA